MSNYTFSNSNTGDLDHPLYFPNTSIDFVNSKSIPPDYTFTRNSSGTYVGPDGLIKTAVTNQPRFDYDPTTGAFRGLLVEEARTNSFTYSEDFSNVVWNKNNVFVSSNVISAPDGTLTADKLIVSNGATSAYMSRDVGSINRTVSFYAKAAEFLFVGGECEMSGSFAQFVVDLTTGQSQIGSGSISTVNAGNGWWKIIISGSFVGSGTFLFTPRHNYSSSSGGWLNISGADGVKGVYFWGAQLETGSFPTSYIPTVASTVTRQPDQLVLNKSLSTSGTFFVEATPTIGTALAADNGTNAFLISPTVNTTTKNALYYNTNRTLIMSSTTSNPIQSNINTPPGLNRVSLGFDRLNNTNYINGYIKKFMYYDSPVTEDNLRSLTGNNTNITRGIVTNGLVLHLDAADYFSYPGSGTIWRDLSGQGKNGTLVNGPTYSSLGGGSIVCDGVNDWISNINPNLTEAQVEGDLTYEYWLQPTQQIYASFTQSTSGSAYFSPGTPQGLANQTEYKYNNQTFAALQFAFGTNGFVAGAHNAAYAPPFLVDYQTYTGISHLIVVKNVYGCSYYVNGVFKKSSTQSKILGVVLDLVTSSDDTYFGRYFKGNIYSYKLYNRALTASEIQQNFNALRGRFGI